MSSGELVFGFVECAVAEHGVEDTAASSGKGDEGLVVAFALADLAVVVGPGDGVAQSRESGQKESPFEHLVAPPGRMFAPD